MTRILSTASMAAFLAAAVFGSSAALAAGSYYKGSSPTWKQDQMIEAKRQARIANGYVYPPMKHRERRIGPANGDYYPGGDSSVISNR